MLKFFKERFGVNPAYAIQEAIDELTPYYKGNLKKVHHHLLDYYEQMADDREEFLPSLDYPISLDYPQYENADEISAKGTRFHQYQYWFCTDDETGFGFWLNTYQTPGAIYFGIVND